MAKKEVPLVIYAGDIRHEIGTAIVDTETGEVEATIPSKQLSEISEVASLIVRAGMTNSFSIEGNDEQSG